MEAKLRGFYTLETELYTLAQKAEDIKAQLAQAKYDLRQAKAAVLEYEGSFRSFLDKLSGKQEAKAEKLTRNLRRAEADVSALTRERESLTLRKEQVEAELKVLPSREKFQSANDPALSKLLHRLEAGLCLRMLQPELEENYEALLAMRDQLQGRNSARIMSTAEIQAIYSRPDTAGEKCRKLLEQLEADLSKLDIEFQIPDYYSSPSAYINAVASDALRRDRVNLALDQVLDMKKRTAVLAKQLEEEENG